jgi:hypothetical protein
MAQQPATTGANNKQQRPALTTAAKLFRQTTTVRRNGRQRRWNNSQSSNSLIKQTGDGVSSRDVWQQQRCVNNRSLKPSWLDGKQQFSRATRPSYGSHPRLPGAISIWRGVSLIGHPSYIYHGWWRGGANIGTQDQAC